MKKLLIVLILSIVSGSCITNNDSIQRNASGSSNISQHSMESNRENVETKKYALVIGNNDYIKFPWGRLRNAVNDAADMKVVLEGLGFKVDFISNGNLEQMQKAIIKFKNNLSNSFNSYGFFIIPDMEHKTKIITIT